MHIAASPVVGWVMNGHVGFAQTAKYLRLENAVIHGQNTNRLRFMDNPGWGTFDEKGIVHRNSQAEYYEDARLQKDSTGSGFVQ